VASDPGKKKYWVGLLQAAAAPVKKESRNSDGGRRPTVHVRENRKSPCEHREKRGEKIV